MEMMTMVMMAMMVMMMIMRIIVMRGRKRRQPGRIERIIIFMTPQS